MNRITFLHGQVGEVFVPLQFLEDGSRTEKWMDLHPRGRVRLALTVLSEQKKAEHEPESVPEKSRTRRPSIVVSFC
jgi:hypothetical protein